MGARCWRVRRPGTKEPTQREWAFLHGRRILAAMEKCSSCEGPLAPEYFQVNGEPICTSCRQKQSAGSGRKALLFGGAAALLCTVLYYGFVELTGSEMALVTIGMGFVIGRAIAVGSGGRGGRRYQFLALLLTYLSISVSMSAAIVTEVIKARSAAPQAAATAATPTPEETPAAEGPLTAQDWGLALGLLAMAILAAPIFICTQSPISIIIYGVGLWEAWKTNAAPVVSGPHPVAAGAAPEP